MTVVTQRQNLIARPARVVTDLVRLTRPVASACAGLQLLVGARLGGHSAGFAMPGPTLVRAAVAIVCIVATVNVVNDIVDVPADVVSQPDRPLAAGRLNPSEAWWLAGALAGVALVLSATVSNGVPVTVGLLAAGLCYDFVLKGTTVLGNVVVATLAATPMLIGGWLGDATPAAYLLGALFIALYMFAFELLKTIRDEEADRIAGYRTVAVAWGTHRAAVLFRATLTVYAAVAASPLLLLPVSWLYGPVMLLGAVVPPLLAGWTQPVERSPAAVRSTLRLMVFAWFPGLVALAVAFS